MNKEIVYVWIPVKRTVQTNEIPWGFFKKKNVIAVTSGFVSFPHKLQNV